MSERISGVPPVIFKSGIAKFGGTLSELLVKLTNNSISDNISMDLFQKKAKKTACCHVNPYLGARAPRGTLITM